MSNKIAVVRRAQFNAAHRLNNPDWDEAKNKEIFGLCNNPSYHGHNYVLEVKVIGEIDPITGYCIDLKIVKDIIDSEVIDAFDHKNLNLDTNEFKELNPTAENIAKVIYLKISKKLGSEYQVFIKLYETERNWVEYPV
jgi:6-pyruvoyltetrahydropterin/6-carboxytetrahydropterin synthase